MSYFTWCLEFKARNNGKIKRQEYLDEINDILKELTENINKDDNIEVAFSTDYKNADFEFVIEVFRDLMMFSVVKEYKQRKKYNV
jgi:hypothetical protein